MVFYCSLIFYFVLFIEWPFADFDKIDEHEQIFQYGFE